MENLSFAPRTLTVSELTSLIRVHLESRFPQVLVCGEISNLRLQSSGHAYFTLKDADAVISCVAFKSVLARISFPLQEGNQIQVVASLKVYEPRGNYQLTVQDLKPAGYGQLMAELNRRREALRAMGLLDPQRKRPLPLYTRRIGIVTSPVGAVLQDVLQVMRRRCSSGLEILVCPARVQGQGAAREIADAIARLNQLAVSVIIVARGGGSMEDLWPFNEDEVIQAITNSKAIVVSGVGHETDFTLCDDVSDVRAPTPSVAAELVVPVREQLCRNVSECLDRIRASVTAQLAARENHCRLLSPSQFKKRLEDRLERQMLSLDYSQNRVNLAVNRLLQFRKSQLVPMDQKTMRRQILNLIVLKSATLDNWMVRIRAVDPSKVLSRGFAMLESSGVTVTTASELQGNENLEILMQDGRIFASVLSVDLKKGT